MNQRHRLLLIALLLVGVLASAVFAQGSALLNSYESLYYYSLRLDDRFPTISPLSTTVQELEKEIQSGLRPDEARVVLGMVYQITGDWDRAIESYARAAANLPNNGSIAVLIGDIHRQQGRWSDAETSYHEALEVDSFARAYTGLGQISLSRNDYSAASEYFSSALDTADEYLAARVGLGQALFYLGEDETAIETLEMALGQNSRSIDANHYLSLLYDRQGESEKAAHAARRAEELRNSD